MVEATQDARLSISLTQHSNRVDACQAYIRSQLHAGWSLLRAKYDDGGYSGGNTDRPGLQRLLDDVQAEKIDVIAVYKVDRLTRSLADFVKLVELFDKHNVGRLPHGIGVTRLTDLPLEWSRQHEMLGLPAQ